MSKDVICCSGDFCYVSAWKVSFLPRVYYPVENWFHSVCYDARYDFVKSWQECYWSQVCDVSLILVLFGNKSYDANVLSIGQLLCVLQYVVHCIGYQFSYLDPEGCVEGAAYPSYARCFVGAKRFYEGRYFIFFYWFYDVFVFLFRNPLDWKI